MAEYSSQKQALTSLKSTPLDADGVTCLHCGGNILDSETPKTCVASQLPHRSPEQEKKDEEEKEKQQKEEAEKKKKQQQEERKKEQSREAYKSYFSGPVEEYDEKMCCVRGCNGDSAGGNYFCSAHMQKWNDYIPGSSDFNHMDPVPYIEGICFGRGCRCPWSTGPEPESTDTKGTKKHQGGCLEKNSCPGRYCHIYHGKNARKKLEPGEPRCPNAHRAEYFFLARMAVFRVTVFANNAPISCLLATHYSVMQRVVLFIPPYDYTTYREHTGRSSQSRKVQIKKETVKFLKEKSLFFDSLLNSKREEGEKETESQKLFRELAM